MIRRRFVLLMLALVGPCLSACQTGPGAASNSTIVPAAAPTAAVTPSAAVQVTIPAPTNDTGVVHGKLLRKEANEPFREGIDLFLGEVLSSDDKQLEMAGLDRVTAPRATPDSTGTFAFSNVKPGRYALIVSTPLNQVLVPDMQDPEQVIVVTIEGATSLDLGTIQMDLKY